MIDIDKAFEGRWRMKRYILENIDGKAAKEIAKDFFEAGILLGQSNASGLPPKVINAGIPNSMEIRSKQFFLSFYTSDNIHKYGQQMLQDFYEYWSEPNPSHTKMRFELQKTWDVNRRLARWSRNNYNRYDRQPTPEQKQSKLTDILIG